MYTYYVHTLVASSWGNYICTNLLCTKHSKYIKLLLNCNMMASLYKGIQGVNFKGYSNQSSKRTAKISYLDIIQDTNGILYPPNHQKEIFCTK